MSNLDTTIILKWVQCIVQRTEFLEKPILRATLYLFSIWAIISEGGCVHKEGVETIPHRRRKNATPVLGMAEPTSMVLTQVASW